MKATDHTRILNGEVWVPGYDIADFEDDPELLLLRRRPQAPEDTQSTADTSGKPKPIIEVSATESPYAAQGRTMSLVSVSFVRDAADNNFGGVRIWLRGYQNNQDVVLIADGRDSPISFLLETTNETVTVIVQAVNPNGEPASLDSSPTTTVTLDGVTSAPPAPTIAQYLIPLPYVGYQFAFNQLSGLAADVIDCYKIYRNASNDPNTATAIDRKPHDPTALGSIVVSDPAPPGVTYFYWVAAVNTSGDESVKTPAQTSTVVSGAGSGKNLIRNPSFELNFSNSPLGDDWIVGSASGAYADGSTYMSAQRCTDGGGWSRSGVAYLLLRLETNKSVPADGQWYTVRAVPTNRIPVAPNEAYVFGAFIRVDNQAVLPANVSVVAGIRLRVYDANGNFLAEIVSGQNGVLIAGEVNTNNTNGYVRVTGWWIVPSTINGGVPAFVEPICALWINNNSGSVFNTGSTLYCDARFDDIFLFPMLDPAGNQIASRGSIPPIYFPGLTYSSTTNSIIWNWNITGYRTDLLNSQFSCSGSQAVTGLLSSSTYKFYPFYDENSGLLDMVRTGGVGNPPWAHTTTDRAWSAEQSRVDRIPLSLNPVDASTTSSGSGGGSGGGDGGCLRKGMFVRERTKGVIRVEEVEVGDYLWSENDTWLKVLVKRERPHDLWCYVEFNNYAWVEVTTGHPWTPAEDRNSTVRTSELTLEHAIPCPTGIAFPVTIRFKKELGVKVTISLESPHTFYASGDGEHWILTHNRPALTL